MIMVEKIYDIIDKLDDSDEVKEILEIKNQIIKNKTCLKLINDFEDAKILYQKYNDSNSFINAKKNLMENLLIQRYLKGQSKINDLTLYINNRINKLTESKTCQK